MAHLQIDTVRVHAELAVFDKDGTLIDFHGVWGGRGIRAVAALGEQVDAVLCNALLQTMGVDRASGRVHGQGILAQLPHAAIQERCLQIMIEAGIAREMAEATLRNRFAPVMRAPPQPDEMLAIGNLAELFAGLQAAGLCLAVLTTDDREATLETLAALGLDEQMSHVVCGDDPVAAKPAPDGILQIAAASGIAPERTLMIGDTLADMNAGRAAGCFCVGVTSGASDARQLRDTAHAVVASVHDIRVLLED